MTTRSTTTAIRLTTSPPASLSATRHARVTIARRDAPAYLGCHHPVVATRTRLLRLTVVIISLLVLSAGCSSSNEQPALDGTSWKLTGWTEAYPIPASVTITAEFTDGRISGTSGVNRYNAEVTSSTDGAFSIDPAMSTKMAGPEDAMAAEDAYLKRLQEATSYKVDGDTLQINDADGQPSLTFTRASA